MRCSKAQTEIELSLGGELNPSRQTVLFAHLKVCPACRNSYAAAEKLHFLLADAPKEVFPAWVHAQIMDKVHRLDSRSPSFIRRFKLAPATALLAIGLSFWAGANLGISSYINSFTQPSPSSSTTLGASETEFGEHSLLSIWSEPGDVNE